VYSSFSAFYTSTFIVFAAPPDPNFLSDADQCFMDTYYPGTVSKETTYVSCCWNESLESGTFPFETIEEWQTACQVCDVEGDTGDFVNCSEPTIGFAPPTPTPSPPAPENALPQGDVQQPTPTPPPTGDKGLFGSEVLPTPSTGLAPPTEPPAPTSEPTVPPETGQGEEDKTGGSGGIKPPVKDLLPDTGITEQPEVQQPEEPSSEGERPAGPLT
jgi:hypothetical protein